MISSPSDYLFVDVPSGIGVDGGIMPARDVAGNGSWRVLRGEDPAFLVEAALERDYARLIGASGDADFNNDVDYLQASCGGSLMDREIRSVRLAEVARMVRYLRPHYASSATLPVVSIGQDRYPGAVHDAYFGAVPLDLGLGIAEASLASAPADFAAGGALRADSVRALYYDFARLRHPAALCVNASEGGASDSGGRRWVSAWTDGAWGSTLPLAHRNNFIAFEIHILTDSAGNASGAWYEASTVDVWIARAGAGGARRGERGVVAADLTDSTTVVLNFTVVNEADNVPALEPFARMTKHVTLPVQATQNATRWTVAAYDFVAAAKTALLMCGVLPYEPGYVSGIANARVTQWASCSYVGTLSDLGGHTDFSALNWPWRPT